MGKRQIVDALTDFVEKLVSLPTTGDHFSAGSIVQRNCAVNVISITYLTIDLVV